MEKRWQFLPTFEEETQTLSSQLKIDVALCRVLAQRGVDSFEKAKAYFRPQLSDLHSPWLMKGMDKAVDRICKALDKNEKILVYGDYDVDGTTSVACMVHFLRQFTGDGQLDFYIPHRYKEGYGISQEGIDFAISGAYSLVIALDCGIKSVSLIGYAKEMGIDFVVCDHHLPGDELPPAVAILNPKQIDCAYPYKELCGCGVGFKLISALSERMNLKVDTNYAYLDLVATAVAADIVPMTGENRLIAFYGLKKANENPNIGIRALKNLSGDSGEMDIHKLVFMIAPRVNAAGRMDDAKKAVNMFLSKSEEEAVFYAEQLHADNSDRKEADQQMTVEALGVLQEDPLNDQRKTSVVFQPHWKKGVIGIVASRLTEHFYRPTIVFTQSGELITGSARSVAGFNLYNAIDVCSKHLVTYGGHFAAAGLTLHPDQFSSFKIAFEEAVTMQILPDQLVPAIDINLELRFDQITPSFYNILRQMEPFGPDNMRPVFVSRGVKDTGHSYIVKEQHLKLVVQQNGVTLTGILFRGAHLLSEIQKGAVDIVYTIIENEFRGSKTLQLQVVDLRESLSH
ncbi:MAG: single-stranded-DNA-specific exonuclease RecJ [Bacteroidota bacterium]